MLKVLRKLTFLIRKVGLSFHKPKSIIYKDLLNSFLYLNVMGARAGKHKRTDNESNRKRQNPELLLSISRKTGTGMRKKTTLLLIFIQNNIDGTRVVSAH